MSENLTDAVVRITGDISPLKKAVDQAQQSLEPLKKDTYLGDIKVNWDEGSGTAEDYARYLAQTNKELEEYQKNQNQTIHSIESATRATKAQAESLITVSESAKQSSNAVHDLKEGFYSWVGSMNDNSRKINTLMAAAAAAVAFYAKSSVEEFAKYDKSFKESQEQAEKSLSKIKASFGSVLAPVVRLGNSLVTFFGENSVLRSLVSSVTALVTVLVGAGGLAVALSRVLPMFLALATATKGLVIGLATAAAVTAIIASSQSDFSETLEETEDKAKKLEKRTKALSQADKEYKNSLSDVAEEIANIRAQMAETERNYKQSLKRILVDHEETVLNLNKQIKEANKEYQRAVDERNASFALSQAKEERKHQEKIDVLMTQLYFLQRYNNQYNAEKLEQVKFAIAKENRLHQEQTAAKTAELELQNQAAKEKHDARLLAYQEELDQELAFLQKHRGLLEGVRGQILDDQVESLTRQYNAQMKSYDKQIENAGKKGAAAAERWSEAYAKQMENSDAIAKAANKAGKVTMEAHNKGLIESMGDHLSKGGIAADIWEALLGKERFNRWKTKGIWSGWASGGYTGSGNPDEVAGVVHKGEYVLPANMVNQSTGTPKNMGNITININGTFATSPAERRRVAEQIVQAINQNNAARLAI